MISGAIMLSVFCNGKIVQLSTCMEKITLNSEEGSPLQKPLAWLQLQPFVLHPGTSEAPATQ
jgi:hypothetical protein